MRPYLLFILSILISTKALSQTEYTEFTGQKSSIHYVKQYVANLYEYQTDAKSNDSTLIKSYGYEIAEEALFRKYYNILKNNKTDTIIAKIILKSRLIIEIDNKKHSFIKYKLVTSDNPDNSFKVLDLINENGRWEENQNSTNELATIQAIMLICKVNTFFSFFNKHDDPLQPELNKLKLQVKDESGILDIEKMYSIIKQHKLEIEKYLE